MIPTKYDDIKEVKEQETQEREKRIERNKNQEPIEENFYLLRLTNEYLIKREPDKLEKLKEEIKKSSALGLAAVYASIKSINESSGEVKQIIEDELKLDDRAMSTTVVFGDGGRPVARKTVGKDGNVTKYEEFNEDSGEVIKTTEYDDFGNVINKDKPKKTI